MAEELVTGKFTHCAPDDPNRCQGKDSIMGQCKYKALEGAIYCPRHNGAIQYAEKKRNVRNYKLQVWQERMDELDNSEGVKSLREEIHILRIIIESFVNRAKDDHTLDLYSPRITDTIMKLEKLVSRCHSIEQSSGHLLDKSSVVTLAGRILDIVSSHIDDSDTLDQIGTEVADMIQMFKPESKK